MKERNLIKISSYTFLLLALVFFNSCAWWEKQQRTSSTNLVSDDGSSQAPFVVDQVESPPNQDAVSISHGSDGLIKTFTLNLKACLRDYIKQDNPIQNIPFTIEYYKNKEDKKNGNLTKTKVVSNTRGCIQWQEQYDYKYTAKPLWIGLERKIKKEKGAYTGEINIPMAVNPWLSERDRKSGLPYILDIRSQYSRDDPLLMKPENYESEGLKYLSETKIEDQPLLWVPDVYTQIHEINPLGNEIKVPQEENLKTQSEEEIRKLLNQYQKICKDKNFKHCYLRQMEMSLYIPLKIRTLDKSGLRKDELLGGVYDVETQLIISSKGAGGNYRLHENVCEKKNIEFNQKKSLNLVCRLNFSYFNQNAFYKLVIRIKSSSPDLPVKKFEGTYTIKLDFQGRKVNTTIDTGYEKNYEEALTTSKELEIIDSLKIKNLGLLNRNENFEATEEREGLQIKGPIKGLDLYRLHLDGYGEYKLSHVESGGSKCSDRENVVERTVVFVGKICLTDVLSSQKLNNTPFRVFLEKPKEGTIEERFYSNEQGEKLLFKTDGRSCISVPIPIKHKIYNRQKYFQVDMHVLSEELNLYGKVRLALSPWQRAFQAFQDAQNLPEKYIRFDTTGIPKPQLIINQFRSINLFPSYGLDKLLNIHLFHRFYLLFQPFIRRPDNLSLGLDFRSRELLRDGHYLVRVLVLRNPQETGDTGEWSRSQSAEDLNQMREKKETDEVISLKGTQYITHTDSVVKAKANFINFYMPLFLSTKQFYYIASRNFIVIEIHSADPKYFVYKDKGSEDEECIVDLQKTVWKPFRNHELESAPYVGAFNIQQWVNWNLLQPAKDIDTDAIIDRSEVGRKYRHFSFSKKENSNDSLNDRGNDSLVLTDCVAEVHGEDDIKEAQQVIYSQDKDTQKRRVLKHKAIKSLNPNESESVENAITEDVRQCDITLNGSLNPGLESYKKQEEQYFSEDVLENFYKTNSLKLIDLSNTDSERFIEDMSQSFKRYIQKVGYRRFLGNVYNMVEKILNQLPEEEILSQLPEEDRNLLNFRIEKICKKTGNCFSDILKAYLENTHHTLTANKLSIQIILDLINQNELASDFSIESLNRFIQSCEDLESCLSAVKEPVQILLDSYMDSLSFYEQNLLLENLTSFFSKQQKQQLFYEIDQQCFPVFKAVFKYPEDYKKCYYKTFSAFYKEIQFDNVSDIYRQSELINRKSLLDSTLQNLNASGATKDSPILTSIMSEPNKQNLNQLIDIGINNKNKYTFDVMSFTKPLCLFWFDHYLKNYLSSEQMIGAYTNFISKFDYNQILDQGYSTEQAMSIYPDIKNMLTMSDNKQSAGCYENYTHCVLADHCQKRRLNESKDPFCSQVSLQDKTCPALLKEECRKDSSLSLCQDECLLNPNSLACGQNSCNSAVRDFCLTNMDHKLCARYENRCTNEYVPCLKANSSVFNVDQVLNYTETNIDFGPLKTCLNDPYDFFKFENKMVIHELSKKKKKYLGGFLEAFNVAANYSIGSYLNWTAQRGRSISGSGDVSANLSSLNNIASKLNLFSASLKMGASQSMSSNESNSGRRAIDNRTGESVYFNISNAKFEIGVKKFQNCLVVKPRHNAFNLKPKEGDMESFEKVWSESANEFKKVIISRPGLILCNPIEDRENKEPKYITEDYYYISQMLASENSEFLNLYDLANRPLVLVLRGRKEFVKLYHILKMTIDGDNGKIEENGGANRPPENMFIEYPFPVEETVDLSLTIREFNETGFSPGIYHYPSDSDQYLDTWYANKTGKNNFIMELLSEYNLFDVPTYTNQTVPIQER